ncbi:hypothetical protein [Silvanigrella aquatica]|uniref:Pyrroloquinoline quinone biosynthesis protein PqqC n=1 Tax=Silvanigrella aquatica TaxID=1915309 RepID=A0A1L4D3K1_9BACT|nr:hypothetical protein [Silvanigrella aquatica]APJ04795.1 hypothetical protein AXG55_13160 [Silvanigrella aquatica]
MKEIMNYIKSYDQKYKELPLITFLNDASIDPHKRISIAPYLAHFAMSFSDINRYVYRDLKNVDLFQEMINEHTFEDDRHADWFLKDFVKLGMDKQIYFSEALKFLWSKDSLAARCSVYDLSATVRYANSFEKFVVLEAQETNGNILFTALTKVAEELTILTGKKYIYFGKHHLNAESGHINVLNEEKYRSFLDSYSVTMEQREQAYHLIDRVYNIFKNLWDDLYINSGSTLSDKKLF